MKRFLPVLAAVGLVFAMSSVASAANVHYSMVLDDNGPGTYAVYAEVGGGDSFGLHSFSLDLDGVIDGANVSPLGIFGTPPFTTNVGFATLRADVQVDGSTGATQSTGACAGTCLFGVGQSPNNFNAIFGMNPGTAIGDNWGVPVKLIEGTYAPSTTQPGFAVALATVFNDATGQAFRSAEEVTFEVIPEPASLALLGLGALAMIRRR